jgi:hypothetical protein
MSRRARRQAGQEKQAREAMTRRARVDEAVEAAYQSGRWAAVVARIEHGKIIFLADWENFPHDDFPKVLAMARGCFSKAIVGQQQESKDGNASVGRVDAEVPGCSDRNRRPESDRAGRGELAPLPPIQEPTPGGGDGIGGDRG